ncbi:hypothetical protein F442_04531 [Phytophthora nicotianae P10297]|uniref:RxLR effector protein n=2 Tax=Phytophthora nicotianae TaxID=4792 RepID=W2ZRY4_PHYNI|nr:hypothetical protein F444_04525 [Phytophthora nicotianae P1976]ETP50068.1 hypothetical protein F442_04531 [Phytophthora nicotianae P10297]
MKLAQFLLMATMLVIGQVAADTPMPADQYYKYIVKKPNYHTPDNIRRHRAVD